MITAALISAATTTPLKLILEVSDIMLILDKLILDSDDTKVCPGC
jgi:hypothetical protein